MPGNVWMWICFSDNDNRRQLVSMITRGLSFQYKKILSIITSFSLRLLHKTVNALRQQPDNIQHAWEKVPEYPDEEIQKDPLIVLRCDRKVYRCPPVFDVLLRTLRGYMTSSRALLNHHVLSNPLGGGKRKYIALRSKTKIFYWLKIINRV